jgi:predicted nucleic acid-binding protein
MSLIIADASPLIGLARIGGLAWCPKLFGQVIVTPTVLKEVLPGRGISDETAIQAALDAGWLTPWKRKIKPPSFSLGDLDEGESECIALALQLNHADTLLLIDERAGRAVATELGIRITGTAAVISLAKKQRLIKAAKPYFAKLHGSDFRLSAAVIQTVLKQVGEA